jgi:vancomycin resistance protein VanJ
MLRERRADVIATEATHGRTAPRAPRTRPAWTAWIPTVVLAALPWGWFAVRDAGPTMDVIAFALPPLAGGLAVLALIAALARWRRLAVVAISLVVFVAVVVAAPRLPRTAPPPVEPFQLVSANTYDGNLEPAAAVRRLVAERPDVLVAVETSRPLLRDLELSLAGAPHARRPGLNLFSRWPLGEAASVPTIPPNAAMRVEVERPGSPFVVYAVHLANPLHDVSFDEHASTVRRLLRAARGETLPVVVAGDFNMTDRSTSYRLLDGAMRDVMRSSFADSTYKRGLWALFQLRIDHVFVPFGWCGADAFTFGLPGSDHEGLSVELGPCG